MQQHCSKRSSEVPRASSAGYAYMSMHEFRSCLDGSGEGPGEMGRGRGVEPVTVARQKERRRKFRRNCQKIDNKKFALRMHQKVTV